MEKGFNFKYLTENIKYVNIITTIYSIRNYNDSSTISGAGMHIN
jgi:hypothetical protein